MDRPDEPPSADRRQNDSQHGVLFPQEQDSARVAGTLLYEHRTDSDPLTVTGQARELERQTIAPESQAAANAYQRIRETTDDISSIHANTAIDTDVITRVKSHLFYDEHVIPNAEGETVLARFSAENYVYPLWMNATNGTLSPEESVRFYHLLAHEYVESRLMQNGWSCRDTADAYGANSLAPHATPSESIGVFDHWAKYGYPKPTERMAADLSNLDRLVVEPLLRIGPKMNSPGPDRR